MMRLIVATALLFCVLIVLSVPAAMAQPAAAA